MGGEGEKEASNEEVDPSKLATGQGSAPPGAERRTDPNPTELPPGLEREQGELDPSADSLLATDQKPDANRPGQQADPNASITQDPDRAPSGTPADPSEGRPDASGKGTPESSVPNGDGETAAGSSGKPSDNADGSPKNPPSDAQGGGANSSNGESSPQKSDGSDAENGAPSGESKETPGKQNPQPGAGANPSDGSDGKNQAGAGGKLEGEFEEDPIAEKADKANLRYSEAATSFALEYLDEQLKKEPDPELLERLGWTKEQLRAFHDKWSDMKRAASFLPDDDPKKDEYLERLRDMGLRDPNAPDALTAESKDDEFRSATEGRDALRTAPPTGFEDRFKAYNQGISRRKP